MLHRKSTYALFFLIFLFFSLTASATTYYLSSSSGNDSNSGTSSSSPWRTLNKLNSFHNLQAGDNVLFKRGDTFYGYVTIFNSGSRANPITFGAYGSGPKPIISGFTNVTTWNNLGGNIWESSNPVSTLSTLKMVVVNGVNTPVGRYPNASTSYPFLPNYFYFQSHNGTGSGATSITSSSLSSGTNWTGADVVVRVNHWTLDKERITSQSGSTISYVGQSSGVVDNWGFFIENDPRTLDEQNEWYYNPSTHKIRIFSSSPPSNVLISSVDTIFYAYNKSDLKVDNLDIQGANTTAVDFRNCNNATITNCDISYTGDVGIDINNQNYSNTADIENNSFNNCGSSSIFTSGGASMIIKNNSVVGSGVISAIKPNDCSNGGILIHNSANSLIQYNRVDSSGYCGIQFRGNGVQVRNNFVNHSAIVRDDGGGIYTGYANETGKVIDGNIVLNSVGNMNGVPVKGAALMSSGIYIDDLGNNIKITNNTMANCSSAGLFLHIPSNITAYNNTCYNNGGTAFTRGGLFVQANLNSQMSGNIVKNNIFFAKNPIQLSLFYTSQYSINDVQNFGTLDSNYYAKPIDPSTTVLSNPSDDSYTNMDLSQWQSYSGKDLHSKNPSKSISDVSDLRFEYNATTQAKTISLGANYIDARGKTYNGSITLAPYSSAVLIKDGPVTTTSTNLLPPVNPLNTVNGVDYKYYEASSYSSLPSFSSSTPVKTGNTSNFDISLANRSTNYAFNFTGYIEIPSDGQYTFYTTSDDGSDLYIDGNLVVANDGLHSATEKSGTIGLQAGKHAISVDYFQAGGENVLSASYEGPGVSKQVIPSTALYRVSDLLPAVNPSNTVNGLDYKYYETPSYTTLPVFSSNTAIKTGSVNNFDISVANRSDDYAINFTGYIQVPADGQYTFYTTSDDGSSLYIDGNLVVDNDGLHSAREKGGSIGLKAGMHAISVGFFEHTGDQVLSISYEGASIPKQVIPSSALYRASDLLSAVNPSNTVNGLDYKYYEQSAFTTLPVFTSNTPIKTGSVNNFDISVANRSDDYAINFTGYIQVPADGQYTFYTTSDDGSSLYIDGNLVVDNDGLHSAREMGGSIGLKAGMHAISLGFFEHTGDQVLSASYEGPRITKQAIPPSALFTTSSLLGQPVMVDPSSALMFSNDSTNFQMQRLLNRREMAPGVKVYPNPFRNSIQIDVNGGVPSNFKLVLSDASGRIVWTKNVESYNATYHESVNTSNLPIGIYFLSLIRDNKSSVTKLVKEY